MNMNLRTKRCFLALAAFLTAFLNAVSAETSGGDEEQGRALFQAQRRVAIVYARVQFYWAMRGRFPAELAQLAEEQEVAPLRPVDPEVLLDPFCANGVFLRYRVVDSNPEIASVGPDGRWGGWDSDRHAFFGQDDIVANASLAAKRVQEYMHAEYSLKVKSGELAYPSVRFERAHGVSEDDARMVLQRPVSDLTACDSPTMLFRHLLEEANLSSYGEQEFLDLEKLGLGGRSWVRSLPAGGTVDDVLSLLGELSPDWVLLRLPFEKAAFVVAETTPSRTDTKNAFFDLCQTAVLRTHRDALGFEWDSCTGHTFAIRLPKDWFDEHSLQRLKTVMARLSGCHHPMVFSLADSVAITEFPSLDVAFFFLDLLPEFIPNSEERFNIREHVRERVRESR